jgi:hypothetical protein
LLAVSERDMAVMAVEKGKNPSALKTHCLRGHKFTEANTRVRIVNGRPNRSCKACAKVVVSSRNQ